MYEAYFGLTEKPFSVQPDPDFLYWDRAHSMAFAMLQYGLMNRAGFTVITGDIGAGKTTLIRHLLNQIDDDLNVGLLSNTRVEPNQLLHWIMMAFDQPFEGISTVALYKRFQEYLIAEYARRGRTVLIIDEAHNLGRENLEELRMLSNINSDKDQLLQLILVGQPQLKDMLQSPEMLQFSQRVSSDFHLRPLVLDEVAGYIDHRMGIAGGDANIFDNDSVRLISEASGGIPRVINILCDTALVYAFATERKRINSEVVRNVIDDKIQYGVFQIGEEAGLDDATSGGVPGPLIRKAASAKTPGTRYPACRVLYRILPVFQPM